MRLIVATRLQFVSFPFCSNEKHRLHVLTNGARSLLPAMGLAPLWACLGLLGRSAYWLRWNLLRCVWWFLFGSVSGIINEGTHGRATINGGCHYFAKGVSVLMLRYPSRYGVRNRLTYHAVSHRVPLPVRVSLRVMK